MDWITYEKGVKNSEWLHRRLAVYQLKTKVCFQCPKLRQCESAQWPTPPSTRATHARSTVPAFSRDSYRALIARAHPCHPQLNRISCSTCKQSRAYCHAGQTVHLVNCNCLYTAAHKGFTPVSNIHAFPRLSNNRFRFWRLYHPYLQALYFGFLLIRCIKRHKLHLCDYMQFCVRGSWLEFLHLKRVVNRMSLFRTYEYSTWFLA